MRHDHQAFFSMKNFEIKSRKFERDENMEREKKHRRTS